MLFPRISIFLGLLISATTAIAESPKVLIATSHGDMVIELAEERAPVTVANFLQYVDDGFYDGTIFHRVIEGFMIQGGGFNADFSRKPTRAAIPNEANNGLRNHRYTISMARTNAPHSATAQFFINSEDNRNLDHTSPTPRGWGYAVFGTVVQGQDIVDKISQVPTGRGGPFSRDTPRDQVVINSARLIVPKQPTAKLDTESAATPSNNANTTEVLPMAKPATTLSVQ